MSYDLLHVKGLNRKIMSRILNNQTEKGREFTDEINLKNIMRYIDDLYTVCEGGSKTKLRYLPNFYCRKFR
jgi:hypothetical protein